MSTEADLTIAGLLEAIKLLEGESQNNQDVKNTVLNIEKKASLEEQILDAVLQNWPRVLNQNVDEHLTSAKVERPPISQPDILPPKQLPDIQGKTWKEMIMDDKYELYPELYLTVLAKLRKLNDKNDLRPNMSLTYPEKSGTDAKAILDDQLVDIVDTFSKIIVDKPDQDALAVLLVNDGRSNPKLYIGGKAEVDPKVKEHLIHVWRILQQISFQKQKIKETGTSRPEDNRVDQDDDNDQKATRIKLKRDLLTTLVNFSLEKIKHRIRKYLRIFCEAVEESNIKGRWDKRKPHIGKQIQILCRELYDIAYHKNDAKDIAVALHNLLKRIESAIDPVKVPKDKTKLDLWCNTASAEIQFTNTLQRKSKFKIHRYWKKCFEINMHYLVLLHLSLDPKRKFLLSLDLDVDPLTPKVRKLQTPTIEHIKLALVMSLYHYRSKIDEDIINQQLSSKETTESLESISPKLENIKEAPVSPVCLVLTKAYKLMHNKKNSRPYNYIGCSKYNCLYTTEVMGMHNFLAHEEFLTPQYRRRICDVVATPCLDDPLEEEIEAPLLYKLKQRVDCEFERRRHWRSSDWYI